MLQNNRNQYCHAFSLPELLICIVVVLLLLLFAIPNFSQLLHSNQLKTEVNQIINEIEFARLAALHHANHVTLCGSKSLSKCDGNFDQGMLIFIGSSDEIPDSTSDKILKIIAPLSYGRLTWNRHKAYLQFSADGSLQSQNGTLLYQHKNASLSRKIVISKTGKLRLTK